jgi:hemerythrin superfamily protein
MSTTHRPTNATASASNLQTLLYNEHNRLDEVFEELLAAFRAGDRAEVAVRWDSFAAGLNAHMALEEEYILPGFAATDPEEAALIAREHGEIRASLADLEVGLDLHCTNLHAAERFIRALRDHAQREEALLYRWAQANLGEAQQASLSAQLISAFRKLAGSAKPSAHGVLDVRLPKSEKAQPKAIEVKVS